MMSERGSERDLRLDLVRGLANWAIFLDHVPNNAIAWVTTKNNGFSDVRWHDHDKRIDERPR